MEQDMSEDQNYYDLTGVIWRGLKTDDGSYVDVWPPVKFDAGPRFLELSAEDFSWMAADALADSRHPRLHLLGFAVPPFRDWYALNQPHAHFQVQVLAHQFRAWLDRLGVSEEEAVNMNEERLEEMRQIAVELRDGAIHTP
ncbi:hypothetical protein [Rhizobium leguminosarum]|uniref:hypothetical protein n=1 Tax=Rhizobium leguminosarum TaxID=384 RepID=UPI002E1279CB|nr:hypothetical protein U8Q02_36870 [Rhizobium leguminosarum]